MHTSASIFNAIAAIAILLGGLHAASVQEVGPPTAPPTAPPPERTPRTVDAIDPEHVVRSILHDSNGHAWFGTWRSGVYRFDGRALTRFTTDDGLADDQVRTILEDRRGTIWFETAMGTSRFDAGTLSTVRTRNYAALHDWRLEPGDLWFKGDSHFGFNEREAVPGAYRFDGTTFHYHAFPLEVVPERRGDLSVTGIDQSRDDQVWIATYGAIFGFDGTAFTTIDDASLGHTDETGSLHARCVLVDSTGRVWIGNNGIGVILFEHGTAINFTQRHGVGRRDARAGGSLQTPQPGDAPAGQPSMHRVFSIGEDRDGNIWFGTIEQGAWRYDGTTLRQFTAADGLETPQVTAIATDANGDLWLGGQGVFTFDGTRFERRF